MERLAELIEARAWNDAWAEFERLRKTGPENARLLLMGSHAALGRRDLITAKGLIEEATGQVAETDPARLEGQILFHLGMVSVNTGDVGQALDAFNQFMDGMSRWPDLAQGAGKAKFYLGLTARIGGRYEEAIARYEEALAAFTAQGAADLVCKTADNLVAVYCRQGDAASARVIQPKGGRDEFHQWYNEALILQAEGQYEKALALGDAWFEHSAAEDRTAVAQAAHLSGMLHLALGDIEHASQDSEIAADAAADANEARLWLDVADLRRRIHLAKAQVQKGA
ncbi:MAG TPA: hypothetical protein VGK74_22100 [Symbiobacteriaceae bacterium]